MFRKSPTTAALIGLCLLTCCACSPKVIREPVKPSVPPDLEARCVPRFEGVTYRDWLSYTLRLREMGGACEADKAAARQVLE